MLVFSPVPVPNGRSDARRITGSAVLGSKAIRRARRERPGGGTVWGTMQRRWYAVICTVKSRRYDGEGDWTYAFARVGWGEGEK